MASNESAMDLGRTGERSKASKRVRYMVSTAMLSAVSIVLMQLEFAIPLMPSFIKLDVSDLPALLGSFAMGPLYGAAIALLKNLMHLLRTSTGGIGELSNFLIAAAFVVPAGLIYQRKKTKKNALIASIIGALASGLLSIVTNYFIVYPFYTNFMPMDAIIGAYQVLPVPYKPQTLIECLTFFNAPFTFFKGMLSVVICFLIYKPLSPIIKGEAFH